jgi:hypothetical protein
MLSTGLLVQSAFAAATVTTPSVTNVGLGTNAGTGSGLFTTLNALTITAGAAGDFAGSLVIAPPTGWEFGGTAPSVTNNAGAVFGAPVVAAGSATFPVTTSNTTTGAMTITGLQIRPLTAGSATGNLTVATSPFGGLAVGSSLGTVNATPFSIGIAATPDATVASDGTDSATLTFTVTNSANAPVAGVLVSVTASRGTLSATSNTTSTSACATGAAGTCTLTFRGNGTTGTAQITATTAAPNEAVATFNVTVGSANTTPTAVKHFSTNNSGHIAANQQSVYTSPVIASRVRFQVTGGSNTGVNNELIQATVDKGFIVQGNSSGVPGTNPGSCQGSNTTASDTSHGPVNIDGTDYDGIVEFTVCAEAGKPGPIKVTAKNLSTSMADATTTLTAAGVPSQITATVTGGAISVEIKDKDGNQAADGTVVTAVAPAFSGAVSPTCTTTSNGKAGFSAAASSATVQVILTVFINDAGDGAPGTCAALGSVAAASTTVNVGGGGTGTPGGSGGGFTGTAPARGSIGLLVTNQASSAAGLVSALAAAGCTVESLAVLESGVWKIYINGAPAVVNTAFPGSVAATTAFFVRCAA